jgi:hypothetical protein
MLLILELISKLDNVLFLFISVRIVCKIIIDEKNLQSLKIVKGSERLISFREKKGCPV